MASRIHAEVAGDAAAAREVVDGLSHAERCGLRPLPSPLPLVPAVDALFSALDLASRDRDLLNAVALTFDDRVEPVLEFDGREAREIVESELSDLLELHAGYVRLADPRLEIWLAATTPPATLVTIHERLRAVFVRREDPIHSQWHRARASLVGMPEAASELIRIARELSEAGLSERALRLAVEAAAHAAGEESDECAMLAGVACVASGFLAEAVDWLSRLFPSASEQERLRGLGGLLLAQAHLQGAVPDVDPTTLRPRSGSIEAWHAWTRAAAFASAACAERGDRRRMRAWLSALDEGCRRIGTERELRDPVTALAWLLSGERDVDAMSGAGPLTGTVLRALQAALSGDIDRGLRILAAEETGLSEEPDPFVAGFERSPLVAAYRSITEVLLLTWRGDLGEARGRLLAAAAVLPVGVPYAGLGAVLARRLDLAVLGRIGPAATSLSATLPAALRHDHLMDRAILAHLHGAEDEAQACLRLWSDRGSVQTTLTVPGIEEMLPPGDAAHRARRRAEPPEVSTARNLRLRIARTALPEWSMVRAAIGQAARDIASPFERARLEQLIAARDEEFGDRQSAMRRLRVAHRLFQVAGATSWAQACGAGVAGVEHGTARSTDVTDPVGASRQRWEDALTERELEVAMLAINGTSNRDIGSTLHLSVRTVEVHLSRVFAKIGVRSRVELTVLAHRRP